MDKKSCECKLCVRDREFKKHLETVPEESKEFFRNIYGQLWDIEEEVDFLNIYQKNLKRLYPGIYKETHTLEQLQSGDEKFPEINI